MLFNEKLNLVNAHVLQDIVKAEELVEKQHETIHCEHKEKEESWNKEKTQIDEKLEVTNVQFKELSSTF